MPPWLLTSCLVIFLISACNPAVPPGEMESSTTPTPSLNGSAARPVFPTRTQTVQPPHPPASAAPEEPTPAPPARVCSPLYGFQVRQLTDILTTKFDPPAPGGEGGHHGVDFAFYSYGAFTTMEGLPVQSVLDGVVAAVIDDRPPYGNMVIVETPLSALPLSWIEAVHSLPAPESYQPDGRLACPTPAVRLPESEQSSLYILYAHLAEKPPLEPGDPVNCGQQIGLAGSSGYSGNTHLHLEIRLGPSGVQFLHLAHYINNATPEEMANYCAWRISPQFRLINPLDLLLVEE